MPQDPFGRLLPPGNGRRVRLGMVLGGLCVVVASVVIRFYWGAESAKADPSTDRNTARAATTNTPPTTTADSHSNSRLKVVAVVNGEQVTRQVLARECLRHYGSAVLESLTNKLLIAEECKRQGIVVSRGDVDAEIQRMARRFSLSTQQWLKMLKKERGVSPAQYASDIIWPALALRRLAGERLTVTRDELIKAYETRYGPSVDARLLASKDLQKARKLHAAAVANPDDFANLAKDHSEDAPSASAGGRIQPIRRHGYYKQIEQAAFSMKDGEISEVIAAGGQYVILKRERLIPAVAEVRFEKVVPRLKEMIRDEKLRAAAQDIFRRLQNDAEVVNVLNDPAKSRETPGVAAVVNGRKIPISQLAEQCIERHGTEVLEGTVNRKLIEQACKKRKITITDADLDPEIARAASLAVEPKPDGSPDVEAWLKLVTREQEISVDVYRHDAVWPSVALKKLVGDTVKITEEDMQKGYEANYGPRVRCRAIVMDDLRRAQRVWEMARNKPTVEYFGKLAEEYSIEPGSRALGGVVPPIKKHGGRPILEKEAFSLKPGELSGIIQVGQRYIILLCEGLTEPTKVDFAEVRKYIYEDIHEKKQRIAMAKYFEHLQDTASIDNYLAGTSHTPSRSGVPQSTARKPAVPTPRQVPGRR